MGMLDDRHAEAALEWQQRQLCREPLHLSDLDLLTGTLGLEQMDVGMVAVVELAARRAVAARSRGRIGVQAEQAGCQIARQRGLADPFRANEKQRVRRPAALDAAPDELERSGMSAGAKFTHNCLLRRAVWPSCARGARVAR